MKKLLLIVLIAASAALSTQAATKYQINIAGVEVNSDNAGYITGGDITGGYGVYNSSTNTLTLYSIKIERDGSGKYGIHNRDCAGLKIVFRGNCYISTESGYAMNLLKNTTIIADDNSNTQLYSYNANTINLEKGKYYFQGNGSISINAYGSNSKEAIIGKGHASSSETNVQISGAKITVKSLKNHGIKKIALCCRPGTDLRITANNTVTNLDDVNVYFVSPSNVAILNPYGAYRNSNYDNLNTSEGTPIINDDIYISDNYVAIFNETYFPDLYFCKALASIFNKWYINQDDVNNTTSLNVSGKNISKLTGVGYFSKLTSLYCNNNNLPYLPSLPSTITTLECGGNQITSLAYTLPSSLKTLVCNSNQLTSLPSLPSSLETLYANNNKFTILAITNNTNLKKLYLNNNTSMTSIICSNNGLTYLDVHGCTALKTIICKDNLLTMNNFDISSCPAITSINCWNNQFSSLFSLPSSIEDLNIGGNKFTTLSIKDRSTLKRLDVSDCTSLTSLYCNNDALTTLYVNNCPALYTIECMNNQLTTLPTLPPSIQNLYIGGNKFTTLDIRNRSKLWRLDVSNSPSLTTLNCNNNALTSLNVTNCPALTSLDCGNNQLTSLPSLPSSLKYLIANSNKLTSLPTLPSSLTTLECNANQLTSLPTLPSSIEGLDVSKNKFTSLTINNKLNLKNLNVSKNTLLTNLNARDNALTSINVTGCSELSYVQLQHNNLTSLYFTGCSKLHDLYITRNQIKGDKMTALINSLRTIPSSESEGVFGVIAKNSGSPEYNEITTEQVKAVRDKRWRAQEIDGNTGRWEDIPVQGSGLRGDVDGNGMVDLDDVNATINLILFYNQYKDKYPGNADLNGDRLIDVDDVKEIINIILEQ